MSDPGPQGKDDPAEPPRSKDLDALLGEIGETLGDKEELPPLSTPQVPWPGWKVWTFAGGLGCGLAGALAAANVWTGHVPSFASGGLPTWVWGGLHGALIGSLSGPACLIWLRARRGKVYDSVQGVGMIVVLSAVALVLVSLLINNLISLVLQQRLYLPPPQMVLGSFWLNLLFGCALAGGVVSHAKIQNPWGRLVSSWLLCMIASAPIVLIGRKMFPYLADWELSWRVGFPYYLAFPLSWWIASRFAEDPLPVLARGLEIESRDDV